MLATYQAARSGLTYDRLDKAASRLATALARGWTGPIGGPVRRVLSALEIVLVGLRYQRIRARLDALHRERLRRLGVDDGH